MKMFYVCEICGNSSGDPQQIERCEKQPTHHEYTVGQLVVFTEKYEKNCETVARGEIKGIYFKVKTHAVIYEVLSKGKKLRLVENRICGIAVD